MQGCSHPDPDRDEQPLITSLLDICAGDYEGERWADDGGGDDGWHFEGTKECIGNCILPKSIKEVADKKHIHDVLDLTTLLDVDEMDGNFGMHPNCKGHETLADKIYDETWGEEGRIRKDHENAQRRHAKTLAAAQAAAEEEQEQEGKGKGKDYAQ